MCGHQAEDDDDSTHRAKLWTCSCWKKKGNPNISAEDELPPGYFWELVSARKALVILLGATACGSVFCFLYIVGSVVLWVAGVVHLFVWLTENWNGNDR